jgi:cell division protein FtsW (lipid II flippase)
MKIKVENQTVFRLDIKINDTKYKIRARESLMIDFYMPRRIRAGNFSWGYSNILLLDKNESFHQENITVEITHFIEKRWIFPVIGLLFILLHWIQYKQERNWATHFFLPFFILLASILKIHIRLKPSQNPI